MFSILWLGLNHVPRNSPWLPGLLSVLLIPLPAYVFSWVIFSVCFSLIEKTSFLFVLFLSLSVPIDIHSFKSLWVAYVTINTIYFNKQKVIVINLLKMISFQLWATCEAIVGKCLWVLETILLLRRPMRYILKVLRELFIKLRGYVRHDTR